MSSAETASPASREPSEVRAEVYCPSCCERALARIRFRYGEPGAFLLGERVRGSNAARVVADGFVEGPCSACGWEGAWPVEVWLVEDRLESVRPPSRKFNWVAAGNYIALPD